MKVLNFASLNMDYVYRLEHIAQAGETISSSNLELYCGGKGLNQSIALAKAGAPVYHAGMIGKDGEVLREACRREGVDVTWIKTVSDRSGHAIIQVDDRGENSIILFPGSNFAMTREFIDEVLSHFSQGDMLVLQNEINELPYIIDKAYEAGMIIVLNPSPYNERLAACDLKKISILILNKIEAEQILAHQTTKPLAELMERYPNMEIVLTLGKQGAEYGKGNTCFKQEIFKVKAVDTTGAGDTFAGYYLAAIIEKASIETAMQRAAMASAIAVSRKGASPSIPYKEEVVMHLNKKSHKKTYQ